MPEFLSEPITPLPGRFEVGSMGRGEPGLPAGFRWRDHQHRIEERLAAGKTTGPDMGEAYVRRHTFTLRMDDGSIWRIYFLRQPPKSRARGAKAQRWYLLDREEPEQTSE